MISVPVIVYVSNQWPADAFWHHVHAASQIVGAELTMVKPDDSAIEQMILKSWLEYAHPAGMA